MSELTNPLFDDEKEFLERKKREYERALVADVEDLKGKSAAVGRIAAVGAGAVGGIWLLAKLFGSMKRKGGNGADRRAKPVRKSADRPAGAGFAPDAEFYTDGLGKRYRAAPHHKSAAQSAAVFAENLATGASQPAHSWDRYRAANPADQGFGDYDDEADDATDDGGFGAGFGTADQPASVRATATVDPDLIGAEVFASAYAAANTANATNQTKHRQAEAESAAADSAAAADKARQRAAAPLPFAAGANSPTAAAAPTPTLPDDPFAEPAARPEVIIPHRASSSAVFSRLAGQGVRAFLQSETGRTLVAQASAVALALVMKQLAKWRAGDQPAMADDLADDLADAPAAAPAAAPEAVSAAAPAIPVAAAAAAPAPRAAASTNKNADLAAAPAVAPAETAAPHPETAAPSDDSFAPSQPPA